VVRLLAAGDPATVERRRWFLARAIADFDAATIDTTHGFCHEVLGGLGLAGDVERGVELVEDVADLVDTVVDDLYVRRFHTTATPELGRAEAGAVARAAIDNPTAPLEPSDGQGVPGCGSPRPPAGS
jgi:exodeoxyribonuclease V beta subunit